MKCFTKKPLASLVALAMGLSAHTVFAQTSDEQNEADLADAEVILITGTKRVTGLQSTPIAVTVTGAEDIQQTRVLDIQDLQSLVPTLRVTPLQRSTNTNFSIRGFGNGTNNTGIEPSVGVFIDGVYRSRAAAQIGDLPRLEQIEVLSGPQSTLFGKNASAGVISVRTAAPSFDAEARAEVGLGNYGESLLRGYFTNGINDTTAFSISAGVNKRDGYTESVVGLKDLNDKDRMNLRGQLLFVPNDETRIRIIADFSKIEEVCCTAADVFNGPTTAAVRALGGVELDTNDPFAYESALNVNPLNEVEDSGFSLEFEYKFDTFDFTSITAHRTNESSYLGDVDFTGLDILTETGETDITTFTQEFRLTSTGDNDFQWMVGAFIFQEDVDTGDRLDYGTGTRNYFNVLGLADLLSGYETVFGADPGTFFGADQYIATDFTQKNDAYSLFASFDYTLTDKLVATLGISYTNDTKDVTIQSDNTEAFSAIDLNNDLTVFGLPLPSIPAAAQVNPALAPLVPLAVAPSIAAGQSVQFLPPQLVYPNSVEGGKTDDSKATWSLRLAYEINDNFNVFATAATGFKASSWNLSRDTRPFPADQAALEAANLTLANQSYGTRYAGPEESTVYELGLKARLSSGSFNITLFDQTIKGFQSSIFVGTGFVLANAGQQSTQGIEFDSNWSLSDNIEFTLAGMFLDPIYDSFEGASGINGPIDLSGETPFGIHDRSVIAGLTYNFDIGDNYFGYIRADYQYESNVPLVANVPSSIRRQVNTINASAGVDFDNGYSLQFWVRNLNNDEYFLSSFPPPIQAGSFNAYPNQPRTYGVTLRYDY